MTTTSHSQSSYFRKDWIRMVSAIICAVIVMGVLASIETKHRLVARSVPLPEPSQHAAPESQLAPATSEAPSESADSDQTRPTE